MRRAALLLFTSGLFAADNALVDRVGSTGFVQLQAESFKQLTPKQQTLVYWLTQASIAIDPIVYDQNSAFGLRQKRLLEEILRADPSKKIADFTKLFWASRGNHNDTTAQKFLPEFTFDELKSAGQQINSQRLGEQTIAKTVCPTTSPSTPGPTATMVPAHSLPSGTAPGGRSG